MYYQGGLSIGKLELSAGGFMGMNRLFAAKPMEELATIMQIGIYLKMIVTTRFTRLMDHKLALRRQIFPSDRS